VKQLRLKSTLYPNLKTKKNGFEILIYGTVDAVKTKAGDWKKAPQQSDFEQLSLDIDLQKLNQEMEGRFLIVRSSENGCFEIATDRYSQFEIYYRLGAGIVDVADTFSALANSESDFDYASVAHTISIYGNRPPKKHTLFKNIKRLGIGETLTFKNGNCEIIAAKPEFIKRYNYQDENEALRTYSDLFMSAIRKRGSEKGNIVFLSSGWDSTSVLAALVHEYGPTKVKALTGRMQYSDRSGIANQIEIDKAMAFAKHFGVELKIVELDYANRGQQIFEKFRPLFNQYNISNITAYNWAILAEAASTIAGEGWSVFAGECSDAAHNLGFSQYATIFHTDLKFREYSDKMMSYLFGPSFYSKIKNMTFEKDEIYNFLKNYFASVKVEGPERERVARYILRSFFLRNSRFPGASLDTLQLLTEEGAQDYQNTMESYFAPFEDGINEENLYASYLYLYNSFHWQGSTVMPLFTVADHFGIQMKLPFWDSDLQNFLSYMPEHFGRGLDLKPTKYPLKMFLKNFIKNYPFEFQEGPHSYIYDVNPRFNHYEELIYHSGLTVVFRNEIKSLDYSKMFPGTYFNKARIGKLLNEFIEGKLVEGADRNDLFSLCMFISTNRELLQC